MGVSGSLYSGVSGLNANANAMSVIGNNIANANTVGFKSSRAIFGDLLSGQTTGSSGTTQIGRGVGLSIVDNIFSQGTFENTETNTDLAVEGAGFFIVSDPATGGAVNNYTRAGAFRFDADGNLVNPEGFNVMGYQLDDDGNTVGDLTSIEVNTTSFTQSGQTQNINLNTNLNSDAQTIAPPDVAASATALDDAIFVVSGATNAAYTDLADAPDDEALQTAALDAATAETPPGPLLTSTDVLDAIADLRSSIADDDDAAIGTSLTNLQQAITDAGGTPNDAYADLAADTTDVGLRSDALGQATADASDHNTILAAVTNLRNGIDGVSFNTEEPAVTSNYATSIQVIDSLGTSHLMTTYFTKTSDLNWQWNTVVDGGELLGGTEGELAVVGGGSLVFDENGNLESIDGKPLYDADGEPVFPQPKAEIPAGSLTWNNSSAQDQGISIDMQTTQYASPSVVVSQEQDGYGTGSLVKLSIDEEGYVIGNFSNGTPRKLMQLALAKFTNPNALAKAGNNLYAQSDGSGVPVVGTVGSGVGNIFTNALELSNVDLASEFVKMITTQRGFSANSKTITTTDEMLAEVINLKR